MEDVTNFFREVQESFTVYVVEQRFAVGRGYEYFKSFKGKENFISNNKNVKKRIYKILGWIQKNIPNITDLIKAYINPTNGKTVNIIDTITALSKLFSVQEHQAVGPEVLDPIIIQEGEVEKKYLVELISLHRNCILQPVIIILLKDNDFERAKSMLTNCPHGINIKMIRNSGETDIYKVINNGSDDIEGFLEAYSQQCFSTCSRTNRKILLNEEWADNSIVKTFSPSLFKIRSNLIVDEKVVVRNELNELISDVEELKKTVISDDEQQLITAFECMSKLFRVFCNDLGGQDIIDALSLAKELDNDILTAHVYRYSHFLPNLDREHKKELLFDAETIFNNNNMADHAIYCRNNRLIHQFHSDKVEVREFKRLQQEALYNVPGLVGMSHIYNNVGVACLLKGIPDEAFDYFLKGLERAKGEERIVQRLALLTNLLLTKSYCFEDIEDNEMRKVLNLIFDTMGFNKLPYIASTFSMNVIAIALRKRGHIATTLLNEYPIKKLITKALQTNIMGSGQLVNQMIYLSEHFEEFKLLDDITIPHTLSPITGIRFDFICRYGLNPFVFNIWI